MAQAPTIPVRTRDRGYSDDGEVVGLAYDTPVLVATGLPAPEDIEVRPFAPHYKKAYQPRHFEIRYVRDLVRYRWLPVSPARKERGPSWRRMRRLAGGKVEEQDVRAGEIIARLTPLPLHRVEIGVRVLFLQGETWRMGRVEDYVHAYAAKRAEVKAEKKIADRKRKRSRYPSVWDRISSDD